MMAFNRTVASLLITVSAIQMAKANYSYVIDSIQHARAIDGDTIEVILPAGSERIRLAGIDAPEKGQAWGKRSKQALQTCISQGLLTVYYSKRDRYQRIVGKVKSAGIDCNLYQISQGLAWHYKEYQKEQPKIDQISYAQAEQQARNTKAGLWQDICVIKPNQWRAGTRDCYSNTQNNNYSYTPAHQQSYPVSLPNQKISHGCDAFLLNARCKELGSCASARQALACGNSKIDGDKDGIPCESLCK